MDLSIVILSFNVAPFLKSCLDSILQYTKDVKYEIIVIDNQSTDDSVKIAKSFGNKIKLIQAKENGGYTKGNNLGIKAVTGKYILILNPDTVFVENSIERMFLWMEAHNDVAVASCQLLDSEQKISPTGGYFPTIPRVLAWAFFLDDIPAFSGFIKSYHPQQAPTFKDKTLYEKEFYPDWVTGAFFVVRKEAIDQVGLLDESIFMYGEELEWCLRLKSAGWRIAYTPITKIIHLERKSSGGLPRNAVLGEFRGLKYIYGKHFPGWQQIVLGSLLDLAAFNRIVFWLIRRRLDMARLYVEALFL